MSLVPPELPAPSQGLHVATIGHLGRFWDVFLELADDPRRPEAYRGLLCFSPSDRNEGEEAKRTTVIFVEPSYEAAVRKAKGLEEHQLLGLLRSVLPD